MAHIHRAGHFPCKGTLTCVWILIEFPQAPQKHIFYFPLFLTKAQNIYMRINILMQFCSRLRNTPLCVKPFFFSFFNISPINVVLAIVMLVMTVVASISLWSRLNISTTTLHSCSPWISWNVLVTIELIAVKSIH